MNRIKLSFSEPKFTKFDDTIICHLSAKLLDRTFNTTASSHPSCDDVFDDSIGERVAMTKAEIDLYNQAKTYLIKYKKRQMSSICSSIAEMKAYIEHNKDYIKKF